LEPLLGILSGSILDRFRRGHAGNVSDWLKRDLHERVSEPPLGNPVWKVSEFLLGDSVWNVSGTLSGGPLGSLSGAFRWGRMANLPRRLLFCILPCFHYGEGLFAALLKVLHSYSSLQGPLEFFTLGPPSTYFVDLRALEVVI
jgi:hypothetical protein